MPRGDRTGPMGYGPMTGRGMGYCAGHDVPGCEYYGPHRLFGRRFARRWFRAAGMPGWAFFGYGPEWTPPAPRWTEADELAALKEEARMLQRDLEGINRRIEELTASAEAE